MDQFELVGILCERPDRFAWFLGAGTSRTAGLPTANDLTRELQRQIYCREENQEISRQDLGSEAVRAKIESFLEAKGLPGADDPSAYSKYFEVVFDEDRERQQNFLRGLMSGDEISLTIGNRVLGALIVSELSRILFTTNFDDVVEKSVAFIGGETLSPFHLEGSGAALNALNNERYPIYCKLHGDFRYESIKNLSEDLKSQNDLLADCMINAAARFGFLVLGYSGRDASIMEVFHRALQNPNPFPHGLYWTGLKGSPPLPAVVDLITIAQELGVRAAYIEIDTFDTFLLRMWRNLPKKNGEVDLKVEATRSRPVEIPLPAPGTKWPLIRLNALPIIEWPTHCYSLSLRSDPDWVALRDFESESLGRLLFTKDERILCWGNEDEIKDQLADDLVGMETADIATELASFEDALHLKNFFERGLCVALCRGKSLLHRRQGHFSYLIADAHDDDQSSLIPLLEVTSSCHGAISGLFAPATEDHPEPQRVFWAEALKVSVDARNGRMWILVAPDVWIWPKRAREMASDFIRDRKANRFNARHNGLLDAWIRTILGTSEKNSVVEVTMFSSDSAALSTDGFSIGTRTAFTRGAN